MKIIYFVKNNWIILLIVFLALVLRLWGIQYGLPGLFVGDEKSLVGGALKMIYQQNIFPVLEPDVFRLLYYPTLIPWLYLIFFVPYVVFVYLTGQWISIAELRDFFIINPSVFFLMARVMSAFFATGAVGLIYLVGKKIFSQRASLLAALLYAVSFLPVHQGHFSKHWNFGIFFALLIFYFALKISKEPQTKNYLKAGFITGLAFFSNYISAIYGLIVVLVHFFLPNQSIREKFFSKKLWVFLMIALLISSLAVLIYPQEFDRLVLGEDSTVLQVKSLNGFLGVSFEILKTLYYIVTFVFLFSLIGYVFLFFKDRKLFFILAFIPLLSPFLYYFLLHFEPRYVLLFLPILALVAGYGLSQFLELFRIRFKWLVFLISLMIIILPLKNAIDFGRLISQADTRNLANDWIKGNIPIGSKIITNSWEFNLIRNQECLNHQQQTNNMSLRSRDYVMMENSFIDSYCVWPLDLIKILPSNVDEYQYYLIDEYTIRRNVNLGEELMERAELIKRFEGSKFDPTEQISTMFVWQRLQDRKLGPTVEIYKLK
ncbi:MAG: glycosyltransferase family 39 protein [bacterium]